MKLSKSIFLLLVASMTHAGQPATSLPTTPIDSGFGSKGIWEMESDSVLHPSWNGHHVFFFHPAAMKTPAPAVFFCHGIGADNPMLYAQLIRHIVSWGYAVLYSPYDKQSAMGSPVHAYAVMRAGFETGFKKWGGHLDTSRIGFVGHSFGAAAVPAIAWTMLTEHKWGKSGAFMFVMAPWYSFQITQNQLDHFPRGVKLIVETFDDDRVNDPRMAIDLFKTIGIPPGEKEFVRLDSDTTAGGLVLAADHEVPEGTYAYGWNVNALDYYGVYRLVNALAVYAFTNDTSAKSVALGHGGASQRFMGKWRNGHLVRELYAGAGPAIRYPQAMYINFWNHAANPRARYTLSFDTTASRTVGASTTISNYTMLAVYQKNIREQEKKQAKEKADSAKEIREKQLKWKEENKTDTDKEREDSLEDLRKADEDSAAACPIRPILSGFGAPGSYTVKEQFFPHPAGGSNYLYCFVPQDMPGRVPVVLFAPELQTTGKKYRELLLHIASRGCVVISSTYRYGLFVSDAQRYEALLQGFASVLELVGTQIDTTRVGFAGHSYGAGALPAVAWHFLSEMRWGRDGAFLFLMSPSYVHCMSQGRFERFPAHAKLLVEVYESDHWNDWRIAEDIFYAINIHPSEKDFVIVKELSHGRQKINAEYQTPYCEDPKNLSPMHQYAIYRPLDALIGYAFERDGDARKICLGNGSPEQVFMGNWWDGTPAEPLVSTDVPVKTNRLWPRGVTASGLPAFFNWIWPFPYSCNFNDKRNERRMYPVP
jgi:hypothetical protein